MLTRILVVTTAIIILSGASFADWNDVYGCGLIPFWINTPTHYTVIVFVNGNEDRTDILHLRFCDTRGDFCSDTTRDMFCIRDGEMLMFSTRANPFSLLDCTHIPVSAPHGYAMFRTVEGTGCIHAFAFIVNDITGRLTTVPIYEQYGTL